MRATKGVAQHRAWLGVAALGTLVYGLALAGAGGAEGTAPPKGSIDKSAVSPTGPSVLPSHRPVRQRVVAGQMAEGDFPLVASFKVDYRDDEMTRARNEGRIHGAWPHLVQQGAVAAAGACSFDVECDLGDPCKVYTCTIVPGAPAGTGKCGDVPVPAGEPGKCDDGDFCNGEETCNSAGDCVGGFTATCCAGTAPGTLPAVCLPEFAICDLESDNAGDPCTKDGDCRRGHCNRCVDKCLIDADCDDGVKCNGTETCDVPTGRCQRVPNPCGANADCDEGRCLGGGPGVANRPCTLDSACPNAVCVRKVCSNNAETACATAANCTGAGTTCIDATAPICYSGRCCTPDLPGENPENDQDQCAKRLLNVCTGKWFAADSGRETPPIPNGPPVAECGGSPTDLSEPYGCPKYSSGITQTTASNPPVHPVAVGPISDSGVTVALAGGPLNALGDDYTLATSSYIGLDVLRWVGGALVTADRILIEFYDGDNNFIEDIVLSGLPTTSVGLVLVEFEPELTIPNTGFVVIRAASNFSPNTSLVWLSTTAASNGTNDDNKLWLNGAPVANFLGANPGIMAFELVGDQIPAPAGACCDPNAEECQDGVAPWVCSGRHHNYSGDTTVCASCSELSSNFDQACRRCSTTCTVDTACDIAGVCNVTITGVCAANVCTVGRVGATCTQDSDCNVGVCTAGKVGSDCTVPADCDYTGSCYGVCLGGNAVGRPCTNECPGGTCGSTSGLCSGGARNGLPCECLGGTCNKGTGLCGCHRDDDCASGGCNETASVCPGGTCDANVTCTNGACCNALDGTCAPATDELACEVDADHTWLGFGTDCDTDNGLDGAEQHCCPQPNASLCTGGGRRGLTCSVAADCKACIGGSTPGVLCTDLPADCPSIPDGTCPAGTCVGGANPGPCTSAADCVGSVGACVTGTCSLRPTGADNAADAFVHVLSVPGQGQPAVTTTITGNNATATSTIGAPDSCFGALPNPTGDPGWFEAFTVNDCAWVRVDHCCTDEVHEPAWAFMATDADCVETIGNTANPYHFKEAPNRRGEPWCANGDDNLWQSFGPLSAGVTYYLPIYSALAGHHGQYQVHITVENCPDAACCKPDATCARLNKTECDSLDGVYLGPPTLATTVDTCPSLRCSGGTYPGTPCLQDINCVGGGTCVTNPHGACTVGSCCLGAGICQDDDLLNHPMTAPLCAALNNPPTVLATFTGGVKCYGGTCTTSGGLTDSCNTDNTGPTPYTPGCNSPCITDAQKDAQRNPCPVCEFFGDDTCAREGTNGEPGRFVWLSDTSSFTIGPATRQANDIRPTSTAQLNHICVIGHYLGLYDLDGDGIRGEAGERIDNCEDRAGGVSDSFTVRLYAVDSECLGGTNNGNPCRDDSECPGGGGAACVQKQYLPGLLIGEWATDEVPHPRNKAVSRTVPTWQGTCPGSTEVCHFYDFQLTLLATPQNPLKTLQSGRVYFLEVSNNTTGGDPDCDFWMLDSGAGQGNNYALLDTCSELYTFDSIKIETGDDIDAMSDPYWCLNVPFESPPTELRACCIGAPLNTCTVLGVRDCAAQGGNWQLDQENCDAPFVCPFPSNEFCADAPLVKEGSFTFDMYGATMDGNAAEQCEGAGLTNFGGDIWYKYRATTGGVTYIGTCDCEHGGDTVVAVYKHPTNELICPCPGDIGAEPVLVTPNGCRDGRQPNFIDPLGCQEFGDQSDVVITTVAGGCYTVRVAMFLNATPAKGNLKIVRSPAECGNNVREPLGGEQCDGTDQAFCPGECLYNCQCPPVVCGDSSLQSDLGEECDPTAPGGSAPCTNFGTTCRGPGHPDGECTCVPSCGNNRVEGDELCDGTDLGICGVGASCRLPNDPQGECRCVTSCGNGVLEVGEVCDPGGAPPEALPDDAQCVGRCSVFCTCPAPLCGNDYVDKLANPREECDGLDLAGEGECPPEECRPAGDPGRECTCQCSTGRPPPPLIVWDSDELAATRSTRSLTLSLTPAPTAAAGVDTAALQIKLVDLQHPNPHNRPQFVTPNFTAFDTTLNGVCSGATTGPNFNGHHCDSATGAADCLGGNTNPAITTDDGTCGSLLACTAAGETGGCNRWAGPVATFREKQDVLSLGTYKAARLQCTPYYRDWTTVGTFTVFGGELLPSSTYEGMTFGSSCQGTESTCDNVSPSVTMLTRRSGDTATVWNPPGTTDQPDGADVVAVLNKFKGLVGSPSNATALLQPNAIDPNADVSGSDIVATVDAFKGLAYPFSGPCVCPSTVTCGALACPPGNCGAGVCVKTCQGGTNDGLPCGDNTHDHCPGGTCPATGFCRDRCGRCN